MGAVAAALLAVALVPRWLEFGVTGPIALEEAPSGLATQSCEPRKSTGEAPATELVVKCYGGSPEGAPVPC